MEKMRFGKTGLNVSRVALGGIPIQRLSLHEAVKVVRRAIDLGVNFIDTANSYTDSEEKIGKAIKDVPRDSLVIASKSAAADKITFLQNIDLSLKRLGTDYIDLYQHHDVSTHERYNAIMSESGAYEGMLEALRSGKVRFAAFSSHSIPVAMRIMREDKFAAVQLPFNYIDDEAAKEAIPLANDLDMGFIAMKPFGGGLLSDARLTIGYLLQFCNVVPDPGIEKESEIEEIVRLVESGVSFSAEDMAIVERVKAETKDIWCHRCGYCEPCPQNININMVLNVQGAIKRMPYSRVSDLLGGMFTSAHNCTECRACVEKCPYHLDIPVLIKDKIVIWDRYISENN